MPIDPRLIFMFLVFATVFSFGQAVVGPVRRPADPARGQPAPRDRRARRLARRAGAGAAQAARRHRGRPLGLQLGLACRPDHALGRRGRAAALGDGYRRAGAGRAASRACSFCHNVLAAVGGALALGIGGPLAYLTFKAGRAHQGDQPAAAAGPGGDGAQPRGRPSDPHLDQPGRPRAARPDRLGVRHGRRRDRVRRHAGAGGGANRRPLPPPRRRSVLRRDPSAGEEPAAT